MVEFKVRPLLESAAPDDQAFAGVDGHIVACAAELFLRRGIEDVKMAEIARAAEVGVATVYRHFSTKVRIAVMAATYLWRRFNVQIREVVESDEFMGLDGLSRLHVLLGAYCDAYAVHGDFVAFLDEFDHLVLSDQVSCEELVEYGTQIDSFYPIFEDAYLLGRMDGSIVRELEFRPFYLATAHSLIGVAEKLRRGEIIPSDDFSHGANELRSIVNMAMWSLVSDVEAPAPVVTIDMRG